MKIVALIAHSFNFGKQMAKDRRAGIVVADARDLERAGLALCGRAELG
jgi:hypothetical protein